MPGTHPASNKDNQGPTTGGERGGSTHPTENTFGPARDQGKSTHAASNPANRGSSGPGTNQHSK
jgi:hypothetical protein